MFLTFNFVLQVSEKGKREDVREVMTKYDIVGEY